MEKLNLICVDDQREVLSAVIQDLDPLASWLNIEDCESAQEVLDLIDELDAEGEHITVIVSDHVMPGKRGWSYSLKCSMTAAFRIQRKFFLRGRPLILIPSMRLMQQASTVTLKSLGKQAR